MLIMTLIRVTEKFLIWHWYFSMYQFRCWIQYAGITKQDCNMLMMTIFFSTEMGFEQLVRHFIINITIRVMLVRNPQTIKKMAVTELTSEIVKGSTANGSWPSGSGDKAS